MGAERTTSSGSNAAEDEVGPNPTFDALRKVAIVVSYYVAGCVFYGHTEGWGVIKTIYFLTTTITTVGYGDVSPVHELSRFVSVFFILFGLAVIFTIIAGVANRIIAAAEAKALAAADDDPTDEKEPHVTKIMISIGMIIFCIMLGAVFYQLNGEFNGRFVKSMWWSLATVTTIGYGDLSLEKDSSRVFTIFFMLFSVIISAAAIGNISAVRDDIVREKKATAALERLDFTMLKHMDKDGDGIDVNEYVIGMLQMLELVDPAKIDMLRKQFEGHDADKSGRLDSADLNALARQHELDALRRRLLMQGLRGDELESAILQAAEEALSTPTPEPSAASATAPEQPTACELPPDAEAHTATTDEKGATTPLPPSPPMPEPPPPLSLWDSMICQREAASDGGGAPPCADRTAELTEL